MLNVIIRVVRCLDNPLPFYSPINRGVAPLCPLSYASDVITPAPQMV